MSNQRYSPEFKDEAIANGHPGLGNRSAAALGLYNNLKLKSRWRRDTAYTDSAARCVTSGPMLKRIWVAAQRRISTTDEGEALRVAVRWQRRKPPWWATGEGDAPRNPLGASQWIPAGPDS